MDWIESNGVSLRYDLGGNGDQTVVLIHELCGSIESFDEVLPELQKNFQVLCYDQRGSGLSEKTKTITLDDLVTDLSDLLDALKIDAACHIAATSLGGAIALAFAIRHPEKVKRLAVASPSIRGTSSTLAAREERTKKIETGGMRSSVEASLEKSYLDILRNNMERYNRFRNRWLANDPEGFIAKNRVLSTLDLTPDLKRITCPTLVIGCKYDVIRTPELTREVAKKIPTAKYIEAETGHYMAVQTPELFVEYILSFFKNNLQSRISKV
ncbi:alpha/beta fold hydrolase [Thermodesulfobacteriota bacterium]